MDLLFFNFFFLPSAVIKFSWNFLGKDLAEKTWGSLVRDRICEFLCNLFDYFERDNFCEWGETQPAYDYSEWKKMSGTQWAADYSALDTLVHCSNQS